MAKLVSRTLIRFGALLLGAPLFGSANLRGELKLSDVQPDAEPKPVWVQIARAGKWMGHPDHPDGVEFTRSTFEQVVANFRANPSYLQGADGWGCKPVIPYDYEHASEMDPTSGTIPQEGAPAPAWALDLDLRASDGGTEELWALTTMGNRARQQVKEREYLWTSVSIWPRAQDSTTAKPIGALLTSIAFTNHPFIKGMEPMAIAARARQVNASVSVYGTAASPEEAIVGMRQIFGLKPEASVSEIASQFERLRTILSAQPAGEEDELYDRAECIASCLRDLLGVPALATLDEIIAAGGQILSALSLVQPQGQPATGDQNMSVANISPTLMSALCKILKLRDGATDAQILASAEASAAQGDALDKLLALFGSSDTQSLLTDAATLVEKAKKAEEYLGALNAANERLGAYDKKDAEAEVEQVAASLRLDDAQSQRLKPLLLSERIGIAGDPVRLAAWRAQYPVLNAAQRLLTTPIVAGHNGTQLGSPATGAVHFSATAPLMAPSHSPSTHPADAYPGRNDIEKAMAYLSDKRPGFKVLSRNDQVHEAGQYLRSGAPTL